MNNEKLAKAKSLFEAWWAGNLDAKAAEMGVFELDGELYRHTETRIAFGAFVAGLVAALLPSSGGSPSIPFIPMPRSSRNGVAAAVPLAQSDARLSADSYAAAVAAGREYQRKVERKIIARRDAEIADLRAALAQQAPDTARDAALEEAAKVCDAQAGEPECPERAAYCAEAIRALKVAEPPTLAEAVARLTDDQRVDLFGEFCRSCGCPDPRCRCWDDT